MFLALFEVVSVIVFFEMAVIVPSSKAYSYRHLAIATLRAPDAISTRQCPSKNGLIPPSSRSKEVIVRSHFYVPSFRGFRLDTASAQ